MAAAAPPVATRTKRFAEGPVPAGAAPGNRQQAPPHVIGQLPRNPAAIPVERDTPGPAHPMPPADGFPQSRLPVQRKLAIGVSTDPLEFEADAAAQAALGSASSRPAPRIRRLHTPPLAEAPPIVHQVLRSPGQPLDDQTRGWAEPAFQSDFRQVRTHTGQQAEASAASMQARAYTVGPQIVLGPGARSSTPEYRRLMAHELAHVVQQGMAPHRAVASSPATRASLPHRAAAPLVQRQDAEDTGTKDLGWFTEKIITVLSGPAQVMGDTAYNLVHSTWHGFFAEVEAHGGEAVDKVKGRMKEFATSPSELLLFFPKYWWGLVKGIVSPITGLFDLVKLGVQLEEIARSVIGTAWSKRDQLAADAKSLASSMRKLGGSAKDALKSLLLHPLDTVAKLGPLLDTARKEANAAAERGGHKIANMLIQNADQPIPDLAETGGEVIGTVLVNVALFVFTDGIGDAIVQIAGKLGDVASWLSKLGKGAQFLGRLAGELGELLATVGKWITGAEEMIAKVAGAILKPLEPVLKEFGELMSGLRTFLRDLLGVAEGAESQEASAAAKGLGKVTHESPPPNAAVKTEPHLTPHEITPKAPVEPHGPEVRTPHPTEPDPLVEKPRDLHEDTAKKPAANDETSQAKPARKPPKKRAAKPRKTPEQVEEPAGSGKAPKAKRQPTQGKKAAPKKIKPPKPVAGSGAAPVMDTGPGIVPEPRTARTGGIGRIQEKRDVFGLKNTTIEGELKPGLDRKLSAPNYNREWKRSDLTDDIAARMVKSGGADPKAAKAAATAFAENYEAAHLWGPGFGDEAAAGMMWAPKDVNQMMQNRFAEKFARSLQEEAAAMGGTVKMTATSVPFDRSTLVSRGLPPRAEFLEHADYKITVELPGKPPMHARVTVKADLPGPKASGSIEFDPPEIADRFMKFFR
ncbi:MAG: DUF4157 domain-containing protein [Terracidiphilus sp.]|jgi:hypothetical protein